MKQILCEVLTDKLKAHLQDVTSQRDAAKQPKVFDARVDRMAKMPGYSKSGSADEVAVFHGREVRKVVDAVGGMGFVLQLSHSAEDPEGWTAPERDGYDGWGHDSQRVWRDGTRLEGEGVAGFRQRFGPKAFTLNHRFYWHRDRNNGLWLSAEDGCEGRLV